jgi:hypothetical protein
VKGRSYGHLVLGNAAIRETNQSSIALRQPERALVMAVANAIEAANLHTFVEFSVHLAKSQSTWPLSGQWAILLGFGVTTSVCR